MDHFIILFVINEIHSLNVAEEVIIIIETYVIKATTIFRINRHTIPSIQEVHNQAKAKDISVIAKNGVKSANRLRKE